MGSLKSAIQTGGNDDLAVRCSRWSASVLWLYRPTKNGVVAMFADFGVGPGEAAVLKEESQRIMFAKQAIKDSLIAELMGWIQEKNLKPAEAAEFFAVPRTRMSDVISKKAGQWTIDGLVEMLLRADKRIQVSVE